MRLLLALAAAAAAWFANAPAAAAAAPAEREIMVMVRHQVSHFRPNAGYAGSYDDDLARSARERLARQIAHQYGLGLVDDWPMPMAGVDCFIMSVPQGRSTQDIADQVAKDSRVAWTQRVQLYSAQGGAPPNDPLFLAQPSAHQWQLASLHRMATGRGVRIAVIDSGVDVRHPDLAGQVALNRNFVAGSPLAAELHGTEVAGVIAAKSGNGLGVAGIAPGARLLALRACRQGAGRDGPVTSCDSFSLAKALYAAVELKAEIINMSLAGPDDRLLRQLIAIARTRGETVVAAFDESRTDGGFPASAAGVVAVADSRLAHPPTHVYIAPGRDIPTTLPGGRWFLVNGTSFAAAHVSGLLALARESRRAGPMLVTGNGGLIDACATVARTLPRCDCSCAAPRTASAILHP